MAHQTAKPSHSTKTTLRKALAATLACVLSLSLGAGLCGCSGFSSTVKDARSFIVSHLDRQTASQTLGTDAVRNPQSTAQDGSVTVLVYMNGSNLESEAGEASLDLAEMVAAGSSDKVNVIVETLGTKEWQDYGISSRRTQRYKVDGSGLTLLDNSLGQLDCTDPATLRDFITWGVSNYPADRYELILWDHGGGPVYGFGYDEWQDEDATLSLDEVQSAVASAGTYFDFIGFDACLMSSIEVCCALYDYCDYMILSEDFESGSGWSYTGWLKALYANPAISTSDLGKIVVDDTISKNEEDPVYGGDATLSVLDESMMKVLFTTWVDFATSNTDTLTSANYSRTVKKSSRALPRLLFDDWDYEDYGYGGYGYDDYDYGYGYGLDGFSDWMYDDYETSVTMEDYYITDILAVAQNVSSSKSEALTAALAEAIIYTKATENDADLTGLSVTLPYGDSSFYSELKTIFTKCGFDSSYIEWLGNFVSAEGTSSFFNYDSWDSQWGGWDGYSDNFDWSSWTYSGDDYWSGSNSLSWSDVFDLLFN